MFEWGQVSELFRTGEYSKCREVLESAPVPDAAFWLSRIDVRQGRVSEAIARLTALENLPERSSAERDIWLANAYKSNSEFSLAHGLLDRAMRVFTAPEEQYYRALYVRAVAYYLAADYDHAAEPLRFMLESANARARAEAVALRGWICAKHRDMRTYLSNMLLSLDEELIATERDYYAIMHTCLVLAVLCRELSVPDGVVKRVREAMTLVRMTEGTAFPFFQSTRILGWADALRGDEVSAMRRWREAELVAPSEFWRVFCIVDRAYLANSEGRVTACRELLDQADAAASRLSWNQTRDEERLILLTIAELFSVYDPVRAELYLARFRTLTGEMEPLSGWIADGRPRALQLYPHAVALWHLGERNAAIEMLKEAWEIFTAYEYGWRAALAALGLYRTTGLQLWLDRAVEQIAPWPNSWIARDVRNAR